MILAVVGFVPVPLVFGFLRMIKNLVLRLVCSRDVVVQLEVRARSGSAERKRGAVVRCGSAERQRGAAARSGSA